MHTSFAEASLQKVLRQLRRLAGTSFGNDDQDLVLEHALDEFVLVCKRRQGLPLLADFLPF
jgi:hypothetical protein